jgi:hypothetical protein
MEDWKMFMKRAVVGALFALLAGPSVGQMMGTPISTSQYFPMVDGARFDYVHSGGRWATSTMVMHTGQTWAGVTGLTGMHTTYVCNVGVSCAMDADDFYRMDPDGMRYFGGAGTDPSGTMYSMMTLTNPEWILSNPVVPGTMMAGGGYSNSGMWQAGVSGSGNMMGSQSYMSSYYAQALETIAVPAGTFANALHVREQRGSGYVRDVWYAQGVGMVRIDDANGSAKLMGYTMPGATGQPGGGAAAMPFTPVAGLWWNPEESGTGYNIQMQHGVMVATMFAYNSNGDPVWYYGVGRPASTGTGVTVTGSLDRYRGGQCITCGYRTPTPAGSDGTFTMVFSSPTEAMVQLPGARTTRIQPQGW